MSDLSSFTDSIFEKLKKINEHGSDYWFARDLQEIFNYKEWRNFLLVIDKAKQACINSGLDVDDHFVDVNKMMPIGKGGKRIGKDIQLSRYACYLIVQNGDPGKEIIAQGQTYFAVQTRRQELHQIEDLDEDEKRLAVRHELKNHNKKLVDAAKDAGVESAFDYAVFQNHGYMGLYGGLKAKDIHARKGLKPNQEILDHMGTTELAANLFRATQAEEKLKRENISGKENANQAHLEVGKKVRQTIKELGGTMPEDLSTPEKSVKQIEAEKRKKLDSGA